MEQTIKKSRFICSIARVSSDEEAQQFIASIQAANKKLPQLFCIHDW